MEVLLYSFLAGLATAIGALILIFTGQPRTKALSGFLGFAGGIMLAISVFDLLPEALELGTVVSTVIGFLLGVAMMFMLDRFVPHAHGVADNELELERVDNVPSFSSEALRTGYLIFFGIAIHNLPEGLAIGAGLEASPELGLYLAVAIGLHNIPEGMAVAAPLRSGGLSFPRVLLLTLIAGMMTPVGAGLGLLVFRLSPVFVGSGLAFAAGAMIYIVIDEVIPQMANLHRHVGNAALIVGLLLGFVLGS